MPDPPSASIHSHHTSRFWFDTVPPSAKRLIPMKIRRHLRALCAVACATATAFAGHPVLVEGNSDSPVPGATIVTSGTSGDFDGDGRISTAEDTDGADRIFGTLTAALGPGTGAAAGTGANHNGSIMIVASGRFAESLVIDPVLAAVPGGNVTIEAAPGVIAVIDAIKAGDPAGGNNTREAAIGITINTPASRVVTLRNLVIRNFASGIVVKGASRVNIENCVIENNRDYGIQVSDKARVYIVDSRVRATGFRVGTTGDTTDIPTPGIGIEFGRGTKGLLNRTSITTSFSFGLKSLGSVLRTNFTQFDNKKGAE
jgi:parallel beta-helix repeat protein